jgi:hypothetical protein
MLENVVLAENASFFRTALQLGLIRGQTVVTWAEVEIAKSNNVPHALIELTLIDPNDITALRYALLGLCTEEISRPVVEGILGFILSDVKHGKRTFDDTVAVLTQVRRFVKIPDDMDEKIRQFEVEGYRAEDRESKAVFQKKVMKWLGRFEDRDDVFLQAN